MPPASLPSGNLPDLPNYFGTAPNPQHALDLFKGEWSTRLPDACGLVASTGPARLCEDYRVDWAARQLGGFAGKHILELGPMEGGHAYMLEKMGAAGIVSLEANSRAYLKCLILKEVFGLTRTRFLLGDFLPYLHGTDAAFDVGFACGVLYHLINPVELIAQLARHCRAVFVWTHFYDPAFMAANPAIAGHFQPGQPASFEGFSHTLHRKGYGTAVQWKGFCGGGASNACWLSSADILSAFEHFEFKITAQITEQNPNSPALLFVAEKT
jgi:SAM-dependent methyltransferase